MKISDRVVFFLLLLVALPAWVGEGWYLIVPPLKSGQAFSSHAIYNYTNNDFDLKSPLSKWVQIGTFGTAADCEASINKGFETSTNLYKEYKKKKEEAQNAGNKVQADIYEQLRAELSIENTYYFARCVASDDPKLKP
ncbi:MAG TPA: hypothetical protein VN944_10925 [Nitrospiria bacterium]|nr:hypothetical protein [Nitrospiria bacterium]